MDPDDPESGINLLKTAKNAIIINDLNKSKDTIAVCNDYHENSLHLDKTIKQESGSRSPKHGVLKNSSTKSTRENNNESPFFNALGTIKEAQPTFKLGADDEDDDQDNASNYLITDIEEHNRKCREKLEKVNGCKLGVTSPDGGWGILVVLGAAIVAFVQYGLYRSYGAVFGIFIEMFHEGVTLTGWIGGMQLATMALFSPFSTFFVANFGIRVTVITSGILGAVCILITALASSIVTVFFAYGIGVGIAGSLSFSPAIVLVSQYFDKYRSWATAIAMSAAGIGHFVFPLIVQYFYTKYDYFGTMLILAGIWLNICVSGALFRPLVDPKRDHAVLRSIERWSRSHSLTRVSSVISHVSHGNNSNGNSTSHASQLNDHHDHKRVHFSTSVEVNGVQEEQKKNIFQRLFAKHKKSWLPNHNGVKIKRIKPIDWELFKDPTFIAYALMLLVSDMGMSFYIFILEYAKEQGLNDDDATMVLSVMGIASVVQRLIFGYAADTKLIRPYRTTWYCIFTITCGVGIILFTTVQTYPAFLALSALVGVSVSVFIGQRSVVAADLFGIDRLYSSFSLGLFFEGIGTLIGPLIGGFLKVRYGVYQSTFIFCGVLPIIGGCLLLVELIRTCRVKMYTLVITHTYYSSEHEETKFERRGSLDF